ncbi:MAG: hypothetical protein B655_2280 [Methanobacterium sp. Maddingley MBC34]|nr:MAG: hypothetical protein B655_2280 [Methanobacterium sp. Maddingley MBC34]
MMGPGTSGIKLKDHAPHINADAGDCWVRALIKLSNVEKLIEIQRSMDKPKDLVCDEEYVEVLKPLRSWPVGGSMS